MANDLFSVCDCCGKKDNVMRGIVHHTFGGYAGYGSKHDGEYITIVLCTECLDRMLDARPPKDTE